MAMLFLGHHQNITVGINLSYIVVYIPIYIDPPALAVAADMSFIIASKCSFYVARW